MATSLAERSWVIFRDNGNTGEVLARQIDSSPFSGHLGEAWLYVRWDDGFECWVLASSVWDL